MKKSRDVKFIIYQALYILVICIVAIKHANLDLVQVMEQKEDIISEDSLRKLYEAIKLLRFVDTNYYVIISKEELEKDKRLAELFKNQPPIPDVTGMIRLQPGQRITTITPEEEKKIEELKKDPGEMKEIRIGNISLTQYTNNTLNNPYDTPLEIEGITSIPPKSSKTFVTGGQGSVVIKVGGATKTVELKPNEKPKISFSRIASMGEDTRVSTLQSSVCYRVVVSDDFPGQLDIKFSGPVSVKSVGNFTYDITMNAFSSKGSFDNYTEGKNSPYSVGFTVSVTDPIAGHKITGQNSFIFGEW
jgi:hypothetical protein